MSLTRFPRRAARLLVLAGLLTAAAARADTPPAAGSLEALGLKPSGPPVREHPGWRSPRLILVSPYLHEQLPQLAAALPAARFVELPQATPRDIAAADATLGVCSSAVLSEAKHLVWIQWLGAGVETCVHEGAVHERHLVLTNMQRTAAPSMAEHVLALMFALSRHFEFFMHEQAQAHWAEDTPPLIDLEGKTVLVVGLGGIGTEVARRAHALGMNVTATRASGHEGPDFVSYVGLPEEMPRLAREADYVINCAPLTPQTTGIFNAGFFASLKPTAYFVNVGRGRSVVTADLTAALESGRIAGAGLDVVDPEPLPADSPLWHAPHLIVTPHVSADTAVTAEERLALLKDNLRRYAAGDALLAVVDTTRGY
ncbi:MAG: D-2-hydroxyacid dehydrogenase [Proteobacteria bacterium]|nr:D-2-hydroxyacid dehydrogenase [Pseudomonadota bacterium]